MLLAEPLMVGLDSVPIEVTDEVWEEDKQGDYSRTRDGYLIRVHRLKNGNDWSTLFHEALHHIADTYGLGFDEDKVLALEKHLVMLLVQNPWLSKGLIDAYTRDRGAAEGPTPGTPGQEGTDCPQEVGEQPES